jgi:uncharacterized protein
LSKAETFMRCAVQIRVWLVAGVFLGLCAKLPAASFPCDKASSYSEVAVCSDPDLSRKDETLAALYQKALARLPDPKAVQWVQRNWLVDDRDQCHTVQCVKDSYSKRIFGLRRQLGEPMSSTALSSQTVTFPTSVDPSDAECANLNAAVKTALNSKMPAASLAQFYGRVVTGWRQSDYEAFLSELSRCASRAEVAPELNAFPDEARMLLTTLRGRAVRIGESESSAFALSARGQGSSLTREGTAAGDAEAETDEPEVVNWQFTRNSDGVVMTSTARGATIYLGNDCDAMSPQYGNGAWTYSNAGWSVQVGSKQFKFSQIAPPLAIHKCEVQPERPQLTQQLATAPAPVPSPQASALVAHPATAAPVASMPSPVVATTPTIQGNEPNTPTGNVLSVLFVVWLSIVVVGIVCGFKGTIVVYRNFDDLAIVFLMSVLPFVGGLAGFYFSGLKDSFAAPLLWGLSVVGTMVLFGWTIARTWRDQQPASAWRFSLALITKVSLGILFLNNLVTLISPSGKTFNARSRARGTALLFLAVLTPIVMRLVREHEGVWAPRNILSAYHRRRMGI